ncbi:MAG: hypothetical protein AAFX78_04815 [Cyanobacteria bacterium J06638_20]
MALEALPNAPTEGVGASPSAAALAESIQNASGESEAISFESALFIAGCLGWILLGLRPEKDTPVSDLQMPEPPIRPDSVALPVVRSTPAIALPKAVSAPETVPMDSAPTVDASEPQTAVREILKAPLYTRIFLGGQRSGKSFAASRLSQYLQQHNGTKVYAINLALVKNPEHWSHANKSAIADLTAPTITEGSALKAIKDAMATLEEFKRHKNALLLIDEWTIIGATTFKFNEQLKPFIDEVCSTITTLSSRGLQADQAVWLIAPHCRLDFLEKTAKALKLCKLCLVAANPVNPFDVDGNLISFDGELFDQVKNNWRDVTLPDQGINSLDSKRIAFINGQWLPLGGIGADFLCKTPASGKSENLTSYGAEELTSKTVRQEQERDPAVFATRVSELVDLPVSQVEAAFQAWAEGKKDSYIIENVWNMSGRYYTDGREKLDRLKYFMEANEDG